MSLVFDHSFYDARKAPETLRILKSAPHYSEEEKESIKAHIKELLKGQDAVMVAHYYTCLL